MLQKTKFVATMAILLNTISSSYSADQSWSDIERNARGQTIDFSYWGRSEGRRIHMDWVIGQMKERFGIHVNNKPRGSITQNDILTDVFELVDGPDFKRLKDKNLLIKVDNIIPNWKYLDAKLPLNRDHGEPIDGQQIPFEMTQLTFMLSPQSPKGSKDIDGLLDMSIKNEGKITYPDPKNWSGMTFLKQALYELSPTPKMMQSPVNPEKFHDQTKMLWSFLDRLHPHLWKNGKEFPSDSIEMENLHEQGELLLSMTVSPAKPGHLLSLGRRVATEAYGHREMMTGFSRVAISKQTKAKEAAFVLVNFLISPEAQAKRSDDFKHGGMPSVLDGNKVPPQYKKSILHSRDGMTLPAPETNASWDKALGQEWTKRYRNHANKKKVGAIPESHHSWDQFLSKEWEKRYGPR